MIKQALKSLFCSSNTQSQKTAFIPSLEKAELLQEVKSEGKIGLLAGNGPFPFEFIAGAKKEGCQVAAVCYENEADKNIEEQCISADWVRIGQLGKMITSFKATGVRHVALAGGISRIKHFGDVKVDARGAKMLMKLRSTKDDVIMRGLADELKKDGIEVVDCTLFLSQCLVEQGLLAGPRVREKEMNDIKVGIDAIKAMSSEDIGQLVVVKDGVVVAVEASEGTDAAVLRGGEYGGDGTVVVKFAKITQDMRFDVPTVGLKTIDSLKRSKARVLALETGRSLIIDKEKVFEAAHAAGISIIGCKPLVT